MSDATSVWIPRSNQQKQEAVRHGRGLVTDSTLRSKTRNYAECVAEAAAKVEQVLGKADIGIVLGSGLGHFSSLLKDPKVLSSSQPVSRFPLVALFCVFRL